VIEIVNLIKTRPVKSRIFELMCKDMDSQHVRLLWSKMAVKMEGSILCSWTSERTSNFFWDRRAWAILCCDYLKNDLWLFGLEYL